MTTLRGTLVAVALTGLLAGCAYEGGGYGYSGYSTYQPSYGYSEQPTYGYGYGYSYSPGYQGYYGGGYGYGGGEDWWHHHHHWGEGDQGENGQD